MTSASGRPVLSVFGVHRLIEEWYGAFARQAPLAEVLPYLANGLVLELPGLTVRGLEEFAGWYAELADQRTAATGFSLPRDVRVRLTTPVHAEVTMTATGTRQLWWVVLRDGSPRIRSISIQQPASIEALSDA
jgi:hypothetical protein